MLYNKGNVSGLRDINSNGLKQKAWNPVLPLPLGEVQLNQNSPSSASADTVKTGYSCVHCDAKGIVSMFKLNLHVERMHSYPVSCKICNVTFVDKYSFNVHYHNCYYQRALCNYHDKRRNRFIGHMHTHKSSNVV